MNNLKQIISSLFVYSNDNSKDNNSNRNNCQTMSHNYTSSKQDYINSQSNLLPQLNMKKYLTGLDNSLKHNSSRDYITKNILFIKEKEAQCKRKKFELSHLSLDNIRPQYRNKSYEDIPSKLHERKIIIRNETKDFHHNNKRKIIGNSSNMKQQLNSNALLLNYHKDFGKTPEYLKKKIEEYNDQKEYQKRRDKEKLLPKGMRLLPETDRLSKLKELNDLKKDLEEELGQMPIARISMKRLLRKGEIESVLKVIDAEYAKYSLKDVIVPIDNPLITISL